MATVEPVFGQIKQGRGFQQFPIRRLKKVNGEWSFICTSHNLLKLFRFRADQPSETRINRFAGNVRPTAWVSDQAGHGVDDYGTVDSNHALSDHFSSEDDPDTSVARKCRHSSYSCPLWRILRTIGWRFSYLIGATTNQIEGDDSLQEQHGPVGTATQALLGSPCGLPAGSFAAAAGGHQARRG